MIHEPEREDRQLPVRASGGGREAFFIGLVGIDLTALEGESKLRFKICRIADIKCTVGFGGGFNAVNFLQRFMCISMASSAVIRLRERRIS